MQKKATPNLMQIHAERRASMSQIKDEFINPIKIKCQVATPCCEKLIGEKSHVNSHDIHLIERFGAVRTFAHAVRDAVVDAVVAEDVPAGLQGRVFEVFPADGAEG